MQTITRLPQPSAKHATCAWCDRDFDTIVELIDHVDDSHLSPRPATVELGHPEAA